MRLFKSFYLDSQQNAAVKFAQVEQESLVRFHLHVGQLLVEIESLCDFEISGNSAFEEVLHEFHRFVLE